MKRTTTTLFACFLFAQLAPVSHLQGQTAGDAFLDGIGETALAARYLFDGTLKDTSRNKRDASLEGSGGKFVRDQRFGQVLSLPGGDGAYVQVPGLALEGADTVSVSLWANIAERGAGALFSFGRSTSSNLFCLPGGVERSEQFRAGISMGSGDSVPAVSGRRLFTNRWAHVVVVLDAASKNLSAFVNGFKVGQTNIAGLSLDHVLNLDNANANHIFIGRTQDPAAPRLKALLRDVRIYNVALTARQIGTIYKNGGGETSEDASGPGRFQEQPPATAKGIAQPMAALLTGVPDIKVQTPKSYLPKLPYTLPATYRDGANGPQVRVIWPSPLDNAAVRAAGVYSVTGKVAGTTFEPVATVQVTDAPARGKAPVRQLEAFPLSNVSLAGDSQFVKNRDKFVRVLAETNPDRFLFMFRETFGEPQPAGAEALGGWDSRETRLRGHATGHYLSALAQAYASATPSDPGLQKAFRQKMDYMVDTLYALSRKSGNPASEGAQCVADPLAVPPGPGRTNYNSDLSLQGLRTDYWNWGKGFISAYPPDQFIMLEKGAVYGGNNNQIWAPYYTLHKILAGLLDCYETGGNPKALEVARDMGRWVHTRLQALPSSTRISMWNRYIAGEYGGMNEVLARLSRITGDRSFLECAKLFDNVNFFFGDAQHSHGLARNVDTLRGKHANQHIPQIIGALETYRNTHDPEYWQVAENFWEICTHSYMYSIGGVAGARTPNNAECFTASPDSLYAQGFSNGGQNETCATYNMLKLTRQLFMFNPDARYMDYYEQALYNHILSSVAENDPGNTYHVPLNPAARKQFGNARMDGFTCCNGTAIESNTKLQDSIYFRSADNTALYVNLFIPSTLKWAEKNVSLRQETAFPRSDTTRLVFAGKGDFALKVRVPVWATRGYKVNVNGKPANVSATPGTYIELGKTWKEGDVVELQMPFGFRLMPVMDQPSLASLFYGPVLLAAEEGQTRAGWRPIKLDSADPGKSINADPANLRFESGNALFKPFYETYGRHSVYLDVTLK